MSQNAPNDQIEENNEWPNWPEELLAAQQPTPGIAINLNLPPPTFEFDLNVDPMMDDPQEVLIHPGAQAGQHQHDWEMLDQANQVQKVPIE